MLNNILKAINNLTTRFLLALLYCFIVVLSLLPLHVLYLLSYFLFVITYHIIKYRRDIVRKNLRDSFPEKTETQLNRIEKRYYLFFCDYIIEFVKIVTANPWWIKRHMKFKGVEKIDEYTSQGISCGVLLGHYGNWEWITSLPLWLRNRNALCCELYHPLENVHSDNFFKKIRQRYGSSCISMYRCGRAFVEYQKKGRPLVVGYIIDQVPNWRDIHLWINFLNHPNTPVFTGSERLIRKMNQKVFIGKMRCRRRGYYECEFVEVKDSDLDNEVQYPLTQYFFKEFEKTIQDSPAFWLWTHNRWKRTIEEFNSRFEVKRDKVRGFM